MVAASIAMMIAVAGVVGTVGTAAAVTMTAIGDLLAMMIASGVRTDVAMTMALETLTGMRQVDARIVIAIVVMTTVVVVTPMLAEIADATMMRL